jgi:alanyl-tRNA synthetase
MSRADGQQEWGAKKVRQTFLDYFNEKNGHTFGRH